MLRSTLASGAEQHHLRIESEFGPARAYVTLNQRQPADGPAEQHPCLTVALERAKLTSALSLVVNISMPEHY